MNNARAMSILEHLDEIKRRLIRVALAFLLFTILAAVFYKPIFDVLREPAENALRNADGDIIFTEAAEAFGATMKVAAILGFVGAVPVFLWETTMFLRPGLTPGERRYLYFLLPFGTVSFVAGAAFGFFVLLPPAINFLLTFGSELATPYITISSYIGLLIALMFWMGLIFEMPIAMFLMAKIGVLNSRWLNRQRRWAILTAFVLGAVITPTFDPVTQCFVAGPIIILYEIGFWLTKLAERGRTDPLASAETPAGGSD